MKVSVSVTGISHDTAPVALRERFAFSSEELPAALACLRQRLGPVAVVSTCNRSEVYLASPDGPALPRRASVLAALAAVRGCELPYGTPFYHLSGREAARHLFRVATGIESLVVGEHEVLGQVRAAFAAATSAKTSNAVLARLFHGAIRAGRRARDETGIGGGGVSVSAVAAALGRRALGDLRHKTVLVVGAGEAARLAAVAMTQQGAGRLMVTTRTFERAREIACDLGGAAFPFDELAALLAEADVVIASTSAPGHVVRAADVAAAMRARPGRPLALIDIAVPRDIDPDAANVEGVRLFDIDDLEAAAGSNRRARAAEIPGVEAIVEDELGRFLAWYEGLAVEPTIAALRRRAEAARRTEIERTLRRMPGLSDADSARIEAMSKALVKRLLHEPVTRLRSAGARHLDAARDLFGLESDAE